MDIYMFLKTATSDTENGIRKKIINFPWKNSCTAETEKLEKKALLEMYKNNKTSLFFKKKKKKGGVKNVDFFYVLPNSFLVGQWFDTSFFLWLTLLIFAWKSYQENYTLVAIFYS